VEGSQRGQHRREAEVGEPFGRARRLGGHAWDVGRDGPELTRPRRPACTRCAALHP
jgi:hypothetical protein